GGPERVDDGLLLTAEEVLHRVFAVVERLDRVRVVEEHLQRLAVEAADVATGQLVGAKRNGEPAQIAGERLGELLVLHEAVDRSADLLGKLLDLALRLV